MCRWHILDLRITCISQSRLAIPQFTIAFAPLMITLQAQGKTENVRQWIEQLINGLTVGGMFVVFGVLLLGNNLVPLSFGCCLSGLWQPICCLFP